jgi:hypothetical protein
MALTESELDVMKVLVEYYGDFNNWKIDHWKNYHLLIKAGVEELVYENNLNNDDRLQESTLYKKETQRLNLETDKLFVIAKKIQYVEGLKADEKFFLIKKLTDEGRSLRPDRIDKPRTSVKKKRVGRPSFKVIYRWLDYLVSEFGSIPKAVSYASDFPMIDPRNPNTITREYRKYRKAKGEG